MRLKSLQILVGMVDLLPVKSKASACYVRKLIDLIHDTHHLCTRFRIDEIKAMPCISGGKQVVKIANIYEPNSDRVCIGHAK